MTVKIHPSSVLGGEATRPKVVMYHEVVQTSADWMRQVAPIEVAWLGEVAPHFWKGKEKGFEGMGRKMPKGAGYGGAEGVERLIWIPIRTFTIQQHPTKPDHRPSFPHENYSGGFAFLHQLLKVGLEPGARLRRRLQRVGRRAVHVVARRALLRRAVALATGLDPHEGVEG